MSKIYIVGTPIGNLKDITYRAIEVLKSVDYIACEDTRVTNKLLSAYSINAKLLLHNKINEKESAKGIISMLNKEDLSIALVSDAGMPLVNDPGFELIKLANENNIKIDLIPGVNAAISAFCLSAMSSTFVYMGFPKEKVGQRLQQIKDFKREHAYIFYVGNSKITNFLSEINSVWGNEIHVFLAREMTKIHEQFYRGNANDVLNELNNGSAKGEFTLVLKLENIKKEKKNKYAQFSKH
ncbi:16S rRNA (cytidine(1402)-2'-O)-methyltransferase [Mycoplasma tauri]|uniref:Ribosomal RNA small subunit methyltransferase I n=1 Tax=Mycoplasma tauri TaxID=547987 RepID=A0A953NC61_9MOLU|nr:16S rRNA (cytidine(1402)-2'-O)-methyltransferase [Mycoplasma tauri]MBZ4195171.1 16S rRNA (cytidine(1402)-2'-O)-methyltransferase [Mycoplasma tauri]MBZ4203366.1 16S rRNA (cytidine(1402)-2'-O)-methyltransferase [Mycoplasma tauri]MBZ4204223.1 16S rRNA (cytidine(1402)-2'-O)-methyltransferase [Mycoplasma tauri]MBZ4212716.1 16S rRNA (cytidine(1402)-2'-O)-methyltransferase [Mycoplasma tauri]MBZ4218016.1 16S rRNA (cytidine(1402)-2'-O)-methyltransferase [Mycoplasma tauri]